MRDLSHINYIKCQKCQHIDINTEIVPSAKHTRLLINIIIIYRYYLLIHRYLDVYNPVYDYISRHINKGINTKKYGTIGTLALTGLKCSDSVGFEKCNLLALIGTNSH